MLLSPSVDRSTYEAAVDAIIDLDMELSDVSLPYEMLC